MTATRPTEGPIGVAVVGTGTIAGDYLQVLDGLDGVAVAAVVDVDEAARTAAATATGAPAFESTAAMFDACTVQAALVLAPPVAHESLCLDLLARGVPVLCEKPIAPSQSAASRMFHAAARTRTSLMMASKFRYVPDVIEAKRMIASGVIGAVTLYDNAFCWPVDMSERWNSDPAVSGGGVLIDNGSHAVDVARFLLGPLVRVMAHYGPRTTGVRVEDTVRVMFETAGATVGLIDLSWTSEKGSDHFVTVQGTSGTLQVGWRGSRYRLHGQSDWIEFGSGYDKRVAFGNQLRNFIGVLRGQEEPQVTPQDAMESVRAVEAAYRSARIGRWVPLHGFDGSSF